MEETIDECMITTPFPTNCTEIIDAIRSGIGRMVTLHVQYRYPCPSCDVNPITDASTNPYCPTCSGLGYLLPISGTEVLSHISHGKLDEMNWKSGGVIDEGAVRIQFKYTVDNLALAKAAAYVQVDGERYKIDRIIKRGFPELNRIILDLSQEDE